MKTFRSIFAISAILASCALAPMEASAQVAVEFNNPQTGTTYTFLNTDCGKLVTFSNAAAVAATLPRAGTTNLFQRGCFIDVTNQGAGAVTITPTTSTVNGQSTLTLAQNQSVRLLSDGTNYVVSGLGSANGSQPQNNFRNVIDNGAMLVQQRGTGTITCAQNAGITAAAYSADRWACQANVAVGAGRMVASTTSPPAGFSGTQQLFRTSGALTQPVCAIQEVPTSASTSLAGKKAVLSMTVKALAGLSADNGNVISMNIITGTGADQGLGSVTASPAITPAWTGVATTQATNFTITTTFARIQAAAVTIPANATEIAVAMCFTPTATGAGVTDGFEFTGVQLEASDSFASPFEFRPATYELANAQRFFWQIADPAATVSLASSCFVVTANTTVKCGVTLPVTMRATPTTTVSTATSFGIIQTAGTASTCSTLAATASSNTLNSIGLTCTTGGTIALGSATPLIGAATAGTLSASADF